MQLRDWNGATGFIYSYFLPGWFTARNLGVGELLKRWKTIFLKFSANGIIFLTILVPFERNRRNGNGSVLSMSRQICTNFRFSRTFHVAKIFKHRGRQWNAIIAFVWDVLELFLRNTPRMSKQNFFRTKRFHVKKKKFQ